MCVFVLVRGRREGGNARMRVCVCASSPLLYPSRPSALLPPFLPSPAPCEHAPPRHTFLHLLPLFLSTKETFFIRVLFVCLHLVGGGLEVVGVAVIVASNAVAHTQACASMLVRWLPCWILVDFVFLSLSLCVCVVVLLFVLLRLLETSPLPPLSLPSSLPPPLCACNVRRLASPPAYLVVNA